MNYLAWGIAAAACFMFFKQAVDLGKKEIKITAQYNDLVMLVEEIKRDDDIFKSLFGKWDRSRGLASTPVTVSVYTSRPQETDDSPWLTADLSIVRRGIVAMSHDLRDELGLEYGQRIMLEGYGLFEIRDLMNSRWYRRVDIWCSDLHAAKLHGVKQNVKMTWAL